MLGRGFSHWGFGPWGFGETELSGELRPQIIYKSPLPGQSNVLETAALQVQFYHEALQLNLMSIGLYIGDLPVYDGFLGFINGARGSVKTLSGVTSIILYPAQGFPYGARTTVRAYAQDLQGEVVDETWSFTVRENPEGYLGADVLPVELQMQQSYAQFIPLDQVRYTLLNYAIPESSTYITNRGNKAARVIYQAAFATELCTLQNPFLLRNEQALKTVVAEKENLLVLDQKMQPYRDIVEAAAVDFRNQGIFTEDYLHSFTSYADAPLYLYRMSLIANLVLYGAAYALGQQSP